jgi:Zn-dependent peptidase ImmA (M78 family)/transcriptional regulator with XRE-family HTH domain
MRCGIFSSTTNAPPRPQAGDIRPESALFRKKIKNLLFFRINIKLLVELYGIIFWKYEGGSKKMDIGNRLSKAREAVGYTQKEVSEKTGVGESSLSDYENNKREPRFSELSRLAELYKRSIDFFLTDTLPAEPIMLWRVPPKEDERKKIESDFIQLSEQYHNLELCTDERRPVTLPQPDVTNSDQFSWPQAELFARKVHNDLCLGDIPSASLKKILEEKYYVKIFHLEFTGSAISTVSDEFGPAILLNNKNASWRRNYDLAHELFHLLTWNSFRAKSKEPNESEEKLANSFASTLLMPEIFAVKVKAIMSEEGKITFDKLDDLAREYEVSLDAVVCRIANIFIIKKEETRKYRSAAEAWTASHKIRESDKAETLPERYRDLAQRALRAGRLSLMQFAKYMGISYKKAQEYLTDDEDFTDEKISISVA